MPLPTHDPRKLKTRTGERRAEIVDDDVIHYREAEDRHSWQLIPPERIGIRACVFSAKGDRMFVLGREHRVFTWDLEQLRQELAQRKF